MGNYKKPRTKVSKCQAGEKIEGIEKYYESYVDLEQLLSIFESFQQFNKMHNAVMPYQKVYRQGYSTCMVNVDSTEYKVKGE